jgi:TnsA-like endonuclease N terminal
VSPVRGFASFRGQRNWPGWWWFSRTAEHVGYESWVERDVLMALDADSGVEAVASQPMSLHWVSEAGKARRHAPDFFVRRDDGAAVVVDVRPDDRIPGRDAEAFMMTASACELAGWEFRRVGELDPVLTANVRWLSRYRHRRCLVPEIAEALLEVFAQGRGLSAGAALAGEPIHVLPVLFHLMWQGRLVASLTGAPLSGSVIVSASGTR